MNTKKRNIIFFILFTFILLPLIFFVTFAISKVFFIGVRDIGKRIGYIQDYTYISGTGSMYPTFPKGSYNTTIEQITQTVGGIKTQRYPTGITLFGKKFLSYSLNHGDIVFFSNNKTEDILKKEASQSATSSFSIENTGFVKRIIALPGDNIEIRNGFVFLNNQFLHEPYIFSPRSTFGGQFLTDCKKITVPEGFLFVMGDNRKISNDSRHDIEFVAIDDVSHVIPINKQDNLRAHWRNTSHDQDFASLPVLDIYEYIKNLNLIRTREGLKQLKVNEKLNLSSQKRIDIMFKYDDFSLEATKSGYTVENALSQAQYANIVWGETIIQGFYTADELLENYKNFPDNKQFILNSDFEDTGVTARIDLLNGCPVQLIVQHFGGYKVPNYPSELVKSWNTALIQLRDTLPGWKELKNIHPFYEQQKEDINRIIFVIEHRINNISIIVIKMNQNQWLTQKENEYLEQDSHLSAEQQSIAKKLNSIPIQ